jgi:hypothetical protein
MPDIYEIKDPKDGSVFEVQLDHPPSPEEARTAVAKYRVTTAKAAGGPMMGADPDAGPLSGLRQMYRKAFPPEAPRLDSNIATVGGIGIAPEDALMAGQAGRAVAGAAKAGGGVIGAAKEAITQASPIVKYEATKHVLTSMGIPEAVAVPIAMTVSGYKRGEPASAPSTPEPSAPTAGTAPRPNPKGPAVRAKSPAAAPVPRTPPPEDPAMSEIVDRMAGGPDKPSPGNGTYRAAAKTGRAAAPLELDSLTAEEKAQAQKWYDSGVKADVILQRIGQSREFTGTMNTATPDEAAREAARMAAESLKRSTRNRSSAAAAVDDLSFPHVPEPDASVAPAATPQHAELGPAHMREIRRIVHELDAMPYTPRLLEPAAKGGGLEHVAGTGGAGAKVYDDVLQMAPGTSKISRGTMQAQLEKYLAGGKMTNAVKGAIEIARLRLEGKSRIPGDGPLSRPELPPSAGEVPTRFEPK